MVREAVHYGRRDAFGRNSINVAHGIRPMEKSSVRQSIEPTSALTPSLLYHAKEIYFQWADWRNCSELFCQLKLHVRRSAYSFIGDKARSLKGRAPSDLNSIDPSLCYVLGLRGRGRPQVMRRSSISLRMYLK